MRRIIGLVILALFFSASSVQAANFYWKATKAGLDGIPGLASGDRGVVIDSGGVATFYYYTGAAWAEATLTGKVPIVSKGTSYTLGTDNPNEVYGGMVFITADALTLTLPAVSAGMSFCVEVVGAFDITVDPNISDGIILTHISATRDTDGDSITNSSAAIGDMVCLIADSANGWTSIGSRGTWAQN